MQNDIRQKHKTKDVQKIKIKFSKISKWSKNGRILYENKDDINK